jgi:ParB-like chromosome segregation protein Spo0J
VQVERVPIDSVYPDPSNVRIHNPRNLDSIKASLRKFGQQKPIVVDRDDIIRAGNGTWLAAKALGWGEIDVIHTQLSGSDATAYAIADNRTAELAMWDDANLGTLLRSLQEEDYDVDATGFTDKEIAALVAGAEPEEDEDEEPARQSLPDKWMVIIECKTEDEQVGLLERFQAEGYSCRAVVG